MTIAVEAGFGFDSAMAKAARGGEGPLAEELILLSGHDIGRSRLGAFLQLLAVRLSRTSTIHPRHHPGRSYGVAIGDILRVQAGEI